jgi:hypothetical protein
MTDTMSQVRDLTEAEKLATSGYPDIGQMNAYYYSFEPTGVPAIDAILGAVGSAGKGFHHTESWSDEIPGWDFSYIDRIQGAALLAAKEFAALSHPAPDVPGAEEVEAIRTWVASNEKRFETWHHDVGDGEVAFDFCVTLLAELDAAKSRIEDYRFALRVLSDGSPVNDAGAAWARSIARGALND